MHVCSAPARSRSLLGGSGCEVVVADSDDAGYDGDDLSQVPVE